LRVASLFKGKVPVHMPASVFAAAPLGMKYTALSRFHSLVVQGGRIGVLSVGIGFVGQGSANMICSLRRKVGLD